MNANTSSPYRPARRWEHDTAMLASSMMLVSISEESTSADIGYKSRLCNSAAASRVGSGSSLSGWGTATTRQSFKMDLSALAQASDSASQASQSPQDMDDDGDWGIVF